MKLDNNNSKVLKQLSRKFYKKHHRKNTLIIISLVLSIVLIYCALAISKGKITSDYVSEARKAGSIATVKIDNGTERQISELKDFDYIESVGIEKQVGSITASEVTVGNLVYLDDHAFEKMTLPAITDVVGRYPSSEDEIMVPIRFLESIGESNPKLGDTLNILVSSGGNTSEQTFKVVGYYTDYADPISTASPCFVSKKYLEENQIPLYPVTNIQLLQKDTYDGEAIETRLYHDLKMESDVQQVIGQTSLYVTAFNQSFGSYTNAMIVLMVILLSMYLFIYNILSISLDNDIKELGLLKTIGTTNKQIRNILLYQMGMNGVISSVVGCLISIAFGFLILPWLIQRLYLTGLGSLPISEIINPFFMFISVFVVLLILALSMGHSLIKANTLPPIASMNFVEVSSTDKSISKVNQRGTSITKMAWQNVTRSRRKLLIMLGSLFLGTTVGLVSFILVNGTDTVNELTENPDFGIVSFFSDESQFIPDSLVQTISTLPTIDQAKTEVVKGNYAKIDLENEAALLPRFLANKREDNNNNYGTIQVVNEHEVKLLKEYVETFHLPIDMDSFEQGNGTILLHHHLLSKQLEEKAEKVIGEPISFYSLDVNDSDYSVDTAIGTLSTSGYLDKTKKAFPKINLGMNGPTINYFIMTEKAFASLGLTEKYFNVDLWSTQGKEANARESLTNLVKGVNDQTGITDGIYMFVNSDAIKAEKELNKSTIYILIGLSVSLLFVGLMSYFNTLQSNLFARKKELSLLKILGMTSNQLRKMVLLEGIIYWLFFVLLQTVIGIPLIQLYGRYMKGKINYFTFEFPFEVFFVLLIMMLITCLITPTMIYKGNTSDKILRG